MLATAGDCWIWPEGAGVRWWTPEETGVLAVESPGDPAIVGQLSMLRDHGTRVPLAQALDARLAKLLETLLRKQPAGLHLRLSRDLPDAWQVFPFQWLTWRSRGLMGRLLVSRHAPRVWSPPAQPHCRDAAILNLWPSTGTGRRRGPFGNLGALDGVQVLIGAGPARHFIRHADLSQFSLLCVIAHGSEIPGDRPFRLADESLWSLPEDERLPPVVLLLACGDDRHNLLEYGRTLLDAGAECVLAPVGRLDADAADGFLRAFLAAWQTGERVSEILRRAQAKPSGRYGADSIEFIGHGDIRYVRAVEIQDRSDEELVAAALGLDSAAMLTLVNRITLRCFQTEGDIEEAPARLYRALNIELGDARREAPLLKLIDSLEERLWPLSRAWVLPLLARLAEEYNHSLLAEYEDIHQQLRGKLPATPHTHHGWSKIYYRQGRDATAVTELADGFRQLAPEWLSGSGGPALFGQLVSILIDLDLPTEGQAVYDLLDASLQEQGGGSAEYHRRNRLDRAGRLLLRRGELEAAAGCFKLRRTECLGDGEDGKRDLAWLLYIGAWGEPGKAVTFANEALRLLGDVGGTLRALGPGNHSEAYLLMALAAWAWRTGDTGAETLMREYLPTLSERLYVQDPGPFGLALGFTHLHALARGDRAGVPWPEARAVLQARHYWLDVAVIDALGGESKQARRSLERFQKHRAQVARHLGRLPAWLADPAFQTLKSSLEQRSRDEREVLLAAKPEASRLVTSGLVPV